MNKKRYLAFIFAFLIALVLFPSTVKAAKVEPITFGENEEVRFSLSNNYEVKLEYKNTILTIERITLCKRNYEEAVTDVVACNSYDGYTSLEADFSAYIKEYDENNTDQYQSVTIPLRNYGTLLDRDSTYKFGIEFFYWERDENFSVREIVNKVFTFTRDDLINGKDSDQDEDWGQKGVRTTNAAVEIINKWVVPILYVVLGIVIIVKSILLAVDIMRHNTSPEERSSKLKAYAYVMLGMFLGAILNTVIGLVTGWLG